MELPDDVLQIISDYSKPLGLRLDWRLGSYVKRHLLLDLECELNVQKYYMFRLNNGVYGNYLNFVAIHLE
jgi:hypothetical protein